MPQDITVTIQSRQTVRLDKNGQDYKILVDGVDTKKVLKKGDTLVLKGDAVNGMLVIEDNVFMPRVRIDTSDPVLVKGSVLVAAKSKQTALMDITPVILTQMQGLDVRRTTPNPKSGTDLPSHLMDHVLKTKDPNLMIAPKGDPEFSEGTKILTLQAGKVTVRAAVEKDGGQMDFINTREAKQLYTLKGSETMMESQLRLNQARNNEMVKVSKALDLDNGLSEEVFQKQKDMYGIPQDQLRGKSAYVKVEPVSESLPAFIELPSARMILDSLGERVAVKPELKKIQQDIIKDADNALTYYGMLLSGKRAPLQDEGKKLGDAVSEVKSAAENLFHEHTGDIRLDQLGKLHESLQSASKNAGIVEDKASKNKTLSDMADKMTTLKKQFGTHKRTLDNTSELRESRVKDKKKVGMLESLVPEGLPKLAMADAGKLPEAMESAIPKIVDFLKGKDGKGAA